MRGAAAACTIRFFPSPHTRAYDSSRGHVPRSHAPTIKKFVAIDKPTLASGTNVVVIVDYERHFGEHLDAEMWIRHHESDEHLKDIAFDDIVEFKRRRRLYQFS